MKIEQLHETVRPVTAIVVGLTLAVICGSLVGKGEPKLVFVLFAGIAALIALLIARERIWMVIPATWMLGGKVLILPLPFTVTQLGVFVAVGMYLVFKALKLVRFKPKVGTVEIWMMIMIVYMVTVFVRNPAGMEALGSDRVGGRPYFDIVVAFGAFWVLARSVTTARGAFIIPLLGLAGYGLNALVNAVADRFPSTIGPLSQLYSGIAAAENPDLVSGMVDPSSRLSYLQGFGSSLITVACALWRPFTIINPVYFWRFLVFFIAAWAILLSGFRSNLFGMIEVVLLSSYLRRGWPEVLRIGIVAVCVVCPLLLVQGTLIELPLPAQRALSFLPGKWDYASKAEAEGSTEWRVTMWKAMLIEDKYIQNKWLGDGFGYTHHQLEIMEANALTGSNADQQENLMISGGVHSGPISTIRYAGYVGLTIFMILLVLLAIRGARLIRRAEGTPFYFLAMSIGMPCVLLPFNFVAVFGSFDNDLPNTIFAIGLQRMLENSLDAYENTQKKKSSPEIVQPPKPRRSLQFAPLGRTN